MPSQGWLPENIWQGTFDREELGEWVPRLREAAGKPPLERILRVTDEALVSADILGDPHSSIVDAQSTMVVVGNTAKVIAWYDNEWGYSARLVDLAHYMTRD